MASNGIDCGRLHGTVVEINVEEEQEGEEEWVNESTVIRTDEQVFACEDTGERTETKRRKKIEQINQLIKNEIKQMRSIS